MSTFKRGLGSPNYTSERATEVKKAGNKAARKAGQIHHWTTEQARAAGIKGRQVRDARKAAEQKAA